MRQQGLKKSSIFRVLICNTSLGVHSNIFESIKSEKEIVQQMLKVVIFQLNKNYILCAIYEYKISII